MMATTRPRSLRALPLALLVLGLCLGPQWARAADPKPGPPLTIRRAAGPINVDGDVNDPGWQGIQPDTVWFETRVGDNVEPQVKNAVYLAYDDSYFYAGFVFDDPSPSVIRAPLGDHDALSGSTDYAGVIVDTRNDGKTAQMFLANARGLQYDALSSDVSGEDSSPDFFWDAAGRITATGWSLEIRIPFTTLRYVDTAQPTWGILLYRNYPRDRRYQFFTARLPRDVSCFICNSSKLSGLADLPKGSHLVVAPFATSSKAVEATPGPGSPMVAGDLDNQAGMDVKWSPVSSMTIDATVNPDFSQIESDVAQIAANERFALFYPEKRPFFLEGVDLFATPFQAVYTRTVTSPRGGLRATGRMGTNSYTALFTQDRGGGLAIIPGPQGSEQPSQDFVSDVGIARVRHDMGQSYLSVLATGRLNHEDGGGGHNVVAGPDFQWRPNANETFTGQFLWSETETPNRTDLSSQWDGRKLSDGAGLAYWSHGTAHEDWYLQYQALGNDFRADNGFIPQVGFRETFLDGGYTFRPTKRFFNRIRVFTTDFYDTDVGNNMLSRRVSVGTGADGKLNSFTRVELNQDAYLVGTQVLDRFRPRFIVQASPSRLLDFAVDCSFGEDIDFVNVRNGTGVSLTSSATLRTGNHVELRGTWNMRWLDVNDPTLGSGRLFTAQVERLRAMWMFNSRAFMRLIGQYVQTTSDPSLYLDPSSVDVKFARLTGSALLAYKLNWQTVLFAGYGDQHDYVPVDDRLAPANQQFFAKASYAWQH